MNVSLVLVSVENAEHIKLVLMTCSGAVTLQSSHSSRLQNRASDMISTVMLAVCVCMHTAHAALAEITLEA
jgi:hypothetical protein